MKSIHLNSIFVRTCSCLFCSPPLLEFLDLKNTGNRTPAQNNREDNVEDLHEHIQMSDSRNAPSTIYDNINLPTNSSASLLYSTVNFTNKSDKSGADALVLKPGSAFEYSTVKFSQTSDEPSRAALEPLYSKANKPK